MVPVFMNVGERSTAKNYCPVSLLSMVSKVFETLDSLVDHLKKCGLFSDFHSDFLYGFRSSQSTADLLIVVYNLGLLKHSELRKSD